VQHFIENRSLPLLLKASWQAGVIILLVLGAQWALGRRLRPSWRFGLWLLVVVRLALPWTIPSAVSLFNFLSWARVSEAVVSLRATPSGAAVIQPTGSALAQAPAQQAAVASAAAPSFGLNLSWLSLAWAAGVFALASGLVITHYRLWRRVAPCRPLIDSRVLNLLEDCKQRMGVRVPVALVETAAVDGPCLFGFLRPRLLLPPEFTRGFSIDEMRYVFLHELGHVKRHDILLGWLMTLLQILHWFNPLVWLAFARMRVDRELACDALALSHAEDQDNKPYGRTIVKLLENFSDSVRAPGLAGIVEDKQQMKERINMIAKFQKTNRGPVLAVFLFIALGLLTLTDAQPGDKTPAAASAGTPAAPRIVSTSPEIGATDVDPAVSEITVSFDQDMGGGFSWTGSGPDYPPIRQGAKAQWRDKRICVLPVKLEAGHFYRVGINSTSHQNFRSAVGVSAIPSAIYFTTRAAGEVLRARTLLPQVIRLDPENGAHDVSPAIAELRVTFSVSMGGGCSWCTAGDDDHDFPKGREGKHMYWTEDKKTCVLPVQLEPGMTYRLSLNDTDYKNFQSEAGVPLEPVAYSFKTSGEPAVKKASETEAAGAGKSEYEQQQLQMAAAGNKWAAYGLWDSYYRGKNGVKPSPANADKWLREFVQTVWLVRFEPVKDFAPASPQEFLERIDHYAHSYSGKTEIGAASFFRTTNRGDKLVGSFLSNYPDQLKASLAKVPGLKVTSVEQITPEKFIEYEQSTQESL
jgi:beta-lactamase regulating signal transducer with metallopeptidase domain